MNDFERIYSVIRSKYICGKPYYEYGNCYYDDIIKNYIQEGTLNLNKSTDYNNINIEDIPIGCSQPVNAIITCSPTTQKIEKPDPGFRLNFQNSSYLYPNKDNTELVLRNPIVFNLSEGEEGYNNNLNSLFLFEKTATFTCLKHINTQKYAYYNDASKSFSLSDICDTNNNVEYKDNNLIYRGLCMTTNGIFTTVPDGNIPILSTCDDKTTNVKMELIEEPIVSFAYIDKKIAIDNIFQSETVPTTFSSLRELNIPTKYMTTKSTQLGAYNTKIKYSKNITLMLTNNIIYITRNEGINWDILTSIARTTTTEVREVIYTTRVTYSDTNPRYKTYVEVKDENITFNDVQDIDMSEDGKYIIISDKINFYVSEDNGKIFNLFKTNITPNIDDFIQISTTRHNVSMSRDGKVQISYIGEIILQNAPNHSIYNISYDYGRNFQRKYFTDLYKIPLSEESNFINNTVITYDGTVVLLLKIKNEIIKIEYLYNEYDIINTNDLLLSSSLIDSKISIDSKNIYMLYDTYLHYSNDYGKTWTKYTFVTKGTFINKIKISKTGKYVFLLVSENIESSFIFYSRDNGNTFNIFQTNDINLNNNRRYFYNLDLTDDGTKLILADANNIYFINTNETPDEYIINRNEKIILPDEDFKYLYKSSIKENNIKINKIIKNGRDLFAIINEIIIFNRLINFIYYDENTYKSFYIPNIETVTNICISNNNMFYTKGNKIYNYSHNEVFYSNKDIVYITCNKVGNLYLALCDKIHISKDSVNWNTVNLEPRKWLKGCMSEEVNINNNYTITIIEDFGNIFVSLDSGVNWKSSNILKPNFWNSISMSNDGIVQLCTCKKDIPYISYDYGVSWLPINFKYNLKDSKGEYIVEFVDCCVSEKGNVMLAIVNNGNILICNNNKWRIYGEYEYNRTEINPIDNHYQIYTSPYIYTEQIDPITLFYNPVLSSYISQFDYNYISNVRKLSFLLCSFKQYSCTNIFEFTLPYNNFIYSGYSKTKDVDTNLDINAEYIEIQFDKNVFFNLNKVYVGSNLSNSNRNNNIANLRIMGSNDGINYKQLINITDNTTIFNLQELVYIVKTESYFNNFRIVLDNIKTIGNSFLNGLNFEGKTKYYCNENLINNWRNVSIKNDNLMVSTDDSFYLGHKKNLIFNNYMLLDNTSDIIISQNTTLTTDIYCKTLTINTSITLNTNGFRIFCTEKLINKGIIQNIGETNKRATDSQGGKGGGSLLGTLGRGGNGGNGGNAAMNGSSTSNCVVSANGGINNTRTKMGGTANLLSNSNIIFNPSYAILGKDDKGNLIGGGGGGAGSLDTKNSFRILSNGGAGGGGGGVIMICAKEIIIETGSKINAYGGDAQPPLETRDMWNRIVYIGGGGGGGGGGTVIIVTTSLSDIKRNDINVKGGEGTIDLTSLSMGVGTSGLHGRIVIVRV